MNTEDLYSIPNTHVRWLTTVFHSSCNASGLRELPVPTYTLPQPHTLSNKGFIISFLGFSQMLQIYCAYAHMYAFNHPHVCICMYMFAHVCMSNQFHFLFFFGMKPRVERTHHMSQAYLKLVILLSQPSGCQDYMSCILFSAWLLLCIRN